MWYPDKIKYWTEVIQNFILSLFVLNWFKVVTQQQFNLLICSELILELLGLESELNLM